MASLAQRGTYLAWGLIENSLESDWPQVPKGALCPGHELWNSVLGGQNSSPSSFQIGICPSFQWNSRKHLLIILMLLETLLGKRHEKEMYKNQLSTKLIKNNMSFSLFHSLCFLVLTKIIAKWFNFDLDKSGWRECEIKKINCRAFHFGNGYKNKEYNEKINVYVTLGEQSTPGTATPTICLIFA